MDPRKLVIHLESAFVDFDSSLAESESVVLAGLSWPTEYWAELAVRWLEQGAPITHEIALALDDISNKPFSQGVRHRAFALARRWQKGAGNAVSQETHPK